VLLDGVATLFTGGYEVAVPVLQRAHRFDAAHVRERAAALETVGHVSSIHLARPRPGRLRLETRHARTPALPDNAAR
jgi:hypothetical protein